MYPIDGVRGGGSRRATGGLLGVIEAFAILHVCVGMVVILSKRGMCIGCQYLIVAGRTYIAGIGSTTPDPSGTPESRHLMNTVVLLPWKNYNPSHGPRPRPAHTHFEKTGLIHLGRRRQRYVGVQHLRCLRVHGAPHLGPHPAALLH